MEREPGVEKFYGVRAIDVPLSVEEAAKSDHFAHMSREAIAADIRKHAGDIKVVTCPVKSPASAGLKVTGSLYPSLQ